MDMATLANIPRRIEVGGIPFLASALTQHEWATFQGWVGEFVPRPEPPEGADAIDRAVYRNAWPPAIASKEWFAALDHPGCFARFVQVALGKHSPRAISDEEALALAVLVIHEAAVADLVMICLSGHPTDATATRPPDPRSFAKMPEGDGPGDIYFHLARSMNGWTHDDVMRLTFPQLRYYRSGGKPTATGVRRYASVAEARAARTGGAVDGG